jgi:hypothetical protein
MIENKAMPRQPAAKGKAMEEEEAARELIGAA